MIELKDVVDDVRSKVRLCDLCFPEPSLEHSDDSLRGHSLLFSLVFSPQDKTSFQTQPFLHVASDHDVVSRLRDCDPVSLATKGEQIAAYLPDGYVSFPQRPHETGSQAVLLSQPQLACGCEARADWSTPSMW